MPGGLREVVIISKFRQNRLNGFRDVGGSKFAISYTHGRRSVGGQGDMSPLLFEVEGMPRVLSHYFLGVVIVCYLKNSLF